MRGSGPYLTSKETCLLHGFLETLNDAMFQIAKDFVDLNVFSGSLACVYFIFVSCLLMLTYC